MIASATAKAAAEAVVNAIPSSSTRGNYVPPPPASLDSLIAGAEGVGHVGHCIISRSRGTARRETSAGWGTDRESLPEYQ